VPQLGNWRIQSFVSEFKLVCPFSRLAMIEGYGDEVSDPGKSLGRFFAELTISRQFDESRRYVVSKDWYCNGESWWFTDWTNANGVPLDEALVEWFGIGSDFCSRVAVRNPRNGAITHHAVKVESNGPGKSIANSTGAAGKQLQRRLKLEPLRIERRCRDVGRRSQKCCNTFEHS
jgi:hypothetical protein